ncbi:hypothetical protein HNP87_001455 [Methanococcus maripaludis]|uniref:GIY-YIG domain-containing protein n=1 Tax=Methanococcus maripaludis TaxID=39152 RepID=A0A7J9NJD0_METMI|nr:GIY-YIG nuclease family protein [Methanococcus maripaludis]MBA2840923.1 hypothetical protein [Methanococcus maripaludis]
MTSLALVDRKYIFEELCELSEFDPQYRQGLYAVFTESSTDGRYSVLYVGETGNYDGRGFSNHHKRPCWEQRKNRNLYIAIHKTPNQTADDRREIESEIIDYYGLLNFCNDRR